MDLGLKIQKTNVRIRINIFEILCVPIFRQNRQLLTFSTQICPKMDFEGGILKISVRMQNQLLKDTMCANFQAKRTTFTFSAHICPKMDFAGGISKI